MKEKRFAVWLMVLPLLVAMVSASCTGGSGGNQNSNSANTNTALSSGLPKDAKPMGQAAPGYFTAGPNGKVSLSFITPADGKILPGDAVAPTFNITNYPLYQDTERDKGQHLHVILDNEPYEADYNPNQPFKAPDGKFENLKEGTHTLRAFPSREWHESIKEEDGSAFAFVVFHVNKETPGVKIDTSKPILTYSRPKGDYRWRDDPRGVLLDFYVANAKIGPNDYKVKYSINGGRVTVHSKWEPIWIKWEELPPGEYQVELQLLDSGNKPVPFMVGNVDYNHTFRKFTVVPQGGPLTGR